MPTSRERVLAALRHEEADRVPIDLGSHASSTIAVLAYMKLRSHLQLCRPNCPKCTILGANIATSRKKSLTI